MNRKSMEKIACLRKTTKKMTAVILAAGLTLSPVVTSAGWKVFAEDQASEQTGSYTEENTAYNVDESADNFNAGAAEGSETDLTAGSEKGAHEAFFFTGEGNSAQSDKDSSETATDGTESFFAGELTAEVGDAIITVTVPASAQLPQNVILNVREILENAPAEDDSQTYSDCLEQAQEVIKEETSRTVTGARFFDISFEAPVVEEAPEQAIDDANDGASNDDAVGEEETTTDMGEDIPTAEDVITEDMTSSDRESADTGMTAEAEDIGIESAAITMVKIEPKDAVTVTITFGSTVSLQAGTEVQAVHLPEDDDNALIDIEATTDDGRDIIEALQDAENAAAAGSSEEVALSEVSFTADSFSVYGVLYTVDFWYGKYVYHLNGEGEIMLSEVLSALGILKTDDTADTTAGAAGNTPAVPAEDIIASMAEIIDVTFSNDELLKIEKADGDWKLTSLKEFDTEETLTIVTVDKVIEIRVTDLHGENIIPVTTKIPLKKTITSNESKADTLEALDGIDINYDIDYKNTTHGNTKEGLTIVPENYALSAATVVSSGTESGNSWTYTLDGDNSPWTLTFTKEGTYEITITEDTSELPEWVEGDSSSVKLTYVVVQEENKLRIAEVYKDPEYEAEPTETTPAQNIPALDLDGLFAKNASRHEDRVHVTRNGKAISMDMGPANTCAAITTNFGFDFSRSFEIDGTMMMPIEDGMGFAFQTNTNVPSYVVASGLYGFDNHNMGTGNGTAERRARQEYFQYGSKYSVNGGTSNPRRRITDSGMGDGFLFVMLNQPASGYASFTMDGLDRNPYHATSGMGASGSESYEYYDHTEEIRYHTALPYTITFICQDHSTGRGVLTVTVAGTLSGSSSKTIVYENFNASEIFGSNNWKEVYFTMGAYVDNQHAHANITISDWKYLDGVGANQTSFWADRDSDGMFETPVNLSDSFAIPGETILVRHDLTAEDPDGFEHTFNINAIITQLKSENGGLTGREAISRNPAGGDAIAAQNQSNASYNTYTYSNGMKVALIEGTTHTYFEYKITAPDTNNTKVYESALFGEPPFETLATETYGFRTEKAISWETPAFTDNVTVRKVTYNPDGGKFDDDTTENKIVKYPKGDICTVISPAPTKEDYVFKGWKLNDTTSYQPGDTFKVTEDVTLTAQWEKECTIIIRCDKNNTLIKSASFILNDSSGTELWSGAADTSTGEVSIPWAEFDPTGNAAFKPGTVYTLIQTATDSTHLTPTGKWTLTVSDDYKITAEGVEEGDTQHQWMVPRTSVENDYLVIYNMPFTTLTIVNNMAEDVDVSALNLNPNMTDPGTSIGSLNNVYFVQETTDSGTTTVTYTPVNGAVPSAIASGETVKLMFSGNFTDYYQIEGGVDTMFKVDLHLSDVGQHFELTETPITGSTSRVTGTAGSFIAKGSMSGAAGATVTFGDVISTPAAYIRIQNQTQQKLTFRLFVGENGAYHQHILKKGSSNQHPIDPVHTDHDGYYYEFTMDAAAENKSETLMLPSAGGLAYNIKVYKEVDGTLTDITDSLASNRVKLNDEAGKVSDPVTGTLKEGPAYTGREIFDTVLADRTKFTNVCYVVLPTVPLTVTKQVTGAMGDMTAANEFEFTISVAGASDTEVFSYTKGDTTGSITNGGTFSLAHGQNIVIEVPPTQDITIQETHGNYTTGFAAAKTAGGEAEIKSTTEDSATLSLSEATTLTVTNTLGDVAPTGLTLRFLPWLILAFAGGMLLLIFRGRRRV